MVLTYHPFNTQIKRYLIQNFRILSTDLQTHDIFPRAPFVAYKHNLSLRNMLVRSTNNSSTEQPGSCACQRSHCNTCKYINPLTMIPGPKCTLTIREHFTCMSENLMYCISCHRCSHLYISETGRSLRSQAFAKHTQEHSWISCGNISTLRATVSQMSRCVVCVCVVAPTSSENNRR